MMKPLLNALLILAICFASSCTKLSPEEELLSDAFDAMKAHNWNKFKALMITTSDYDMKAHGTTGRFKEQLSYSHTLREDEWAAQKANFERALESEPGYINFNKSEFKGVGRKMAAGAREILSGGTIDVETYALKVKNKGSGADEDNLLPYFAISKWEGKPKILAIAIPPEDGEESEEE